MLAAPFYAHGMKATGMRETHGNFNEIHNGGILHPPPHITAKVIDAHPTDATQADFAVKLDHFRLSFDILDVLEKYGQHLPPQKTSSDSTTDSLSVSSAWIGKFNFLPHVYYHVQQRQPVQLTLPSFPCKSLNRTNKVLGHLPDLGEELALCRLHAMCQDVKKVYAYGAEVNIASDGVLFNDILGITDEDCWDYGEALQAIIQEKGLTTVRFIRCMSLLGILGEEDINRETYLSTVESCRQQLETQYGVSDKGIANSIKSDKDTALTYCGMVKFLQSEMETSPTLAGLANAAKIRVYKSTAKKMMQRSEAFTAAIRALRPHHVRLSMHPSSGAAKLSIALVPGPDGAFQKSPWHSCVAVGSDGSYTCVHSEDVRDTHDLVYQDGRPYCFRQRSSGQIYTSAGAAVVGHDEKLLE